MNKKNILLLNSTLHYGGAEYVIANLCRYLDRKLFNVTVCHLKEQGWVGKELSDADYDVVGLTKVISGQKPDYFSVVKLSRLIKKKTFTLCIRTMFIRLSRAGYAGCSIIV